jgi:hypothetical protein
VLEASGIRVAEYLTELPPRPLLEQNFHEAVVLARSQLEPLAGPQRSDKSAPDER